MKIFKMTLALLLIISLICMPVFAEDSAEQSYKMTVNFDTNEITMVEQSIKGETDYSDLPVDVIKSTNDGQSLIYTGPLSGYDNGAWVNTNFDTAEYLMILDWATIDDEAIYIVPIRETDDTSSVLAVADTTGNLMPSYSNLAITSQIKLNGVTVNENGMRIIDNANMSCTFNFSNSSEEDGEAVAMLATYTETGKLNNIKTFTVEIGGGENKSVEIAYSFDADNESSGKLMLWNSMSGLTPIRASIDFSQTSGINAYYYDLDNRLLQIDKMNGTTLVFTYDNMGNLLTKTVRE